MAQLLVADEGERSTELFVPDDRGLRDRRIFVEGPIRQFDAAITECQPTVGIIDDGDPLADRHSAMRPKGAGRNPPCRDRVSETCANAPNDDMEDG